ncbi:MULTISPECIES: hypothetical protein [Acinetobacter]|uniref:Uncharacterized protein n=2 Tax=Acinetobacter variabilis TaxID=70346 RepID=N9MJB7_9GAMM|nr:MULTISPECIES: hypothetical protein [Acinetobacter]ENX08643.1 hypothetical protein F897_01793 [Acinetobacter variabilis]UBI30810.1 hypothetical protein LA331_01165 [Acinetobacter variabilis]
MLILEKLNKNMSEANKVQFKVELELYLKSPEDIQKWALNTLESNPSDELALEVCFLANSQEVIEYFKNIHITDLDINTRNNVIHKLLNKYVLSRIISIRSKEDIYLFFQNIILFSKYLEDKKLNNLLISYDDKLYLALENYSPLEPMEVFHNFINELQEWQKTPFNIMVVIRN